MRSAPGNGTTFRITFPLVDESSAQADPSQRSGVQSELPAPLRVLAVDDEPMMTKAVVRMLRPSGHLVSVAASGEEALEQLSTRTFDVVVSDMGMGAGINGWELADAVKRQWPADEWIVNAGNAEHHELAGHNAPRDFGRCKPDAIGITCEPHVLDDAAP